MTRRVKIYGGTLLVLALVKVAWFFAFRADAAKLIAGEDRADLMARRAYLIDRLLEEKTDAKGMKTPGGIFTGEWFVGSMSMTVFACTNLAYEYPETREETVRVIDRLLDRALEPAARDFDRGMWKGEDALDSLDGPNGHVGYLGHVAMAMAARRLLAGPGAPDPHEAVATRMAEALARRMRDSPTSHLETYPGETYAMDNCVAAAAIAVHDLGTGADHRAVLERYVAYTRDNLLDPETGLVSFSLGRDGRPNQRSRGSGVGWNSFFMPFVDPAFAAGQFDRIREHLVDSPWGITGVREVRRGVDVRGDVDSGPVLLGLSPSGTGFAMAGARRAGDVRLLGAFLDTAELAGFTWQWGGERRYLLAPFVGDAIVLAMKTARPWDRRFLDARP